MNTLLFSCLLLSQLLSPVHLDTTCGPAEDCLPATTCKSYLADRRILNSFTRGSKEYKDHLLRLRGSVCNTAERKVCCRNENPIPKSDNPDDPNFIPSFEKEECGLTNSAGAYILGGKDTRLGEFPYLALLGKDSGDGIFLFCGATIINKWYVLTAAHCEGTEFVRVGEWNVVDEGEFTESDKERCQYYNDRSKRKCRRTPFCKGKCKKADGKVDCEKPTDGDEICAPPHQDYPVALTVSHPDFSVSGRTLPVHDLRLIKVAAMMQYNFGVQPACLPVPGEEFIWGTIVGWGRKGVLEDLGFLPPEAEPVQVSTPNQQYLNMPMLSTEECLDKYFSLYQVNLTGAITSSEHLCAGGVLGEDACKGDSGGPLLARTDSQSSWQLVGIVSGGSARCGLGAPGLFTKVINYYQWITENMK